MTAGIRMQGPKAAGMSQHWSQPTRCSNNDHWSQPTRCFRNRQVRPPPSQGLAAQITTTANTDHHVRRSKPLERQTLHTRPRTQVRSRAHIARRQYAPNISGTVRLPVSTDLRIALPICCHPVPALAAHAARQQDSGCSVTVLAAPITLLLTQYSCWWRKLLNSNCSVVWNLTLQIEVLSSQQNDRCSQRCMCLSKVAATSSMLQSSVQVRAAPTAALPTLCFNHTQGGVNSPRRCMLHSHTKRDRKQKEHAAVPSPGRPARC
jgi:hypothetical protein